MKLALLAGAGASAALVVYFKYFKRPKSKLTLGYWKIRGLAAPARMMLAYAKAAGTLLEFEDVTYELMPKEGGGFSNASWMEVAKPPLREQNPLINLPYLIDHDAGGLLITQSTAVYQHLGRELGLMGDGSAAQTAGVEQILAQAFDLRNDTMKLVYPFGTPAAEYATKLVKHMDGPVKNHLSKLEAWLAQAGDGAGSPSPFFVGGAISAGDFHVFEMLDQHEKMAAAASLPSPLRAFPRLAALHAAMRALPQLQDYFASDAYGFICNNKMANFK